MADTKSLRAAVQSLFPSNVKARFGQVPAGETLPWSFVLISIPSVTDRRLAGNVSTRRCVIRVRAAGANDTAAGAVAQNCANALEGVRPTASGWSCSPIRQLNDDAQVYQDRDTTVGTLHPIVAALDFEFFASVSPVTPPPDPEEVAP